MNMPYHIIIDINNDIEHQVFQEFDINIKIKQSKIKDNENWGVIGKSKIIINLPSDIKEVEIKFKLFPLLDDCIKIPEIEFFENEILENKNNINDNIVEFNLKKLILGVLLKEMKELLKLILLMNIL